MAKVISVIVLLLVIVAGGYMYVSRNNTTISPEKEAYKSDKEKINTEVVPSGKKMAFASFVKQGGSYQCTVHQYVNDTDTVGDVYLDNGKIRGEFKTTYNGMNIDTSFIVRDGYTYTWTSAMPTMGFKAPVVDSETTGSADTSGTYSWNNDQIGDYDCKAWAADQSKFAIPTSVKFTEAKR